MIPASSTMPYKIILHIYLLLNKILYPTNGICIFSGSSTQHSAEITPVLPKRETRGASRRGAESGGGSIVLDGGRRRSGGGSDRGNSDVGGSGSVGGAGVDYRHRHHRRALREARRGIGWEESSDDEAVSVSGLNSVLYGKGNSHWLVMNISYSTGAGFNGA